MPKKRDYFPNNWKAYHKAPSHFFDEIEYDEFMDWKVSGWEIPASVNCIIRERNLETNKVTEYVYQRASAAQRKLKERMALGTCEFTVCHADAIHQLMPEYEEDYDDPLA